MLACCSVLIGVGVCCGDGVWCVCGVRWFVLFVVCVCCCLLWVLCMCLCYCLMFVFRVYVSVYVSV